MYGIDKLLLNEEVVFWTCVCVLIFALALLIQKRINAAHERAAHARAEAEQEDLGGNSYFMPLPPADPAVEISDPVEIDSLLAGESITVAQGTRLELEKPTDISLVTDRGPDTVLPVAPAAAPPKAPPAPPTPMPAAAPPRPAPRIEPVLRPPTPAAAPASSAKAPAPAAPPAHPASGAPGRVPVRELVLTWYEARGYRAALVPNTARPIELALHHRKDVDRIYAFVVERDRVSPQRAVALLEQARAAGYNRLLIAAEGGCVQAPAEREHQQGIRLFDEAAIRAELDKIDISVAAKIIAVARGRAQARLAAALARFAPENRAKPTFTARF